MSFVFYDTETTGTNTTFDQILQFAAIRTDYELKETDRFEIRCRLLSYVVPAPGAMRVTGVTVDQLIDPALPSHYGMVRAIRAKLDEWSPAIFIGHNSLSFDEHLLRQAFYKTLHPPYLTNSNGNCRSDSLRIIQTVNNFEPGIISVPVDERGRQTFKLDRLAPSNGFNHSAAHDAMGDVEAVVHLCRILAEHTDGHWSNFVRFAQKAAVLDFAQEEDVFSLTDIFYGNAYSWMVTTLGLNPDNGAQLLVFDLSIDPDDLVGLGDDDLAARLSQRPKPVRTLRTNACPCILAYEDTPEHLRPRMTDIVELRNRAARLRKDEAFRRRLIAAFSASREEKEPSSHVEEQIYDGFAANADQALMTRFHDLPWSDRAGVVANFADHRLKALGERLVYIEAPDTLPAQTRAAYDVGIAERLMAADGSVPWLTLSKAITETNDMLAVASGSEADLLRDLHDYLVQRAEEAGTLLA